MKKTFRMALVLALAGAALTYTGCTKDYSEDLSKLDERVSSLESSTALADLTKQVNSLKTTVDALEAAKKAADEKIASLQSKAEATDAVVESLRKQVADNVATIASIQKAMENYATKAEIEAANAKIAALQEANTTLTNQVKDLLTDAATLAQAVGKLQGLAEGLQTQIDDTKAEIAKKADQTYVDATFATKQTVENIATRLGVLEGTIAAINEKLDKCIADLDVLNGNELVEGSVKQQIKAAKDELTAAYIAADDALRAELTKAIDAVRDALTAETSARKEADDALWKNFDNYYTVAQIDAKETAIKGLIAAEAEARVAADKLLGEQIAAVEAGYKAADAEIIKNYKAADEAIIAAYKKADEEIIAAYKAADKALDEKVDAAVKALEEADAQLQKNIDALKAEIMKKFEDYYTAAEVDALVKKLQDQVTANAEAIEALKTSKLDVAAFEAWKTDVYAKDLAATNKAIADEIKRATEAEDALVKVDEDLQKQIDAIKKDIETKYKEYTDKVAELEKAIAARDAKVAAIAERVQAISFVPQYTKGDAPVAVSTLVKLDGKALKTQQTVEASFQVKPAAKAKAVAEACKLVYVPVTTKAAAAPAEATKTEVLSFNTSTGMVNVRASVPTTAANIAVALVYEEAEVEGQAYANNKVVSDYAAVAQDVVEIKDAVDIYKGNTKYGDQAVQKPWDEAPAQVTWYEGGIYKVAGMTFADFRAKYDLSTSDLPDPVMKVKYAWTVKKTGKALVASKAIGASAEDVVVATEDYVKMVSDVLAKAAVGEKTTGTNNIYVKGVKVATHTNSYEIIKRQIDATIEPYTIVWNYINIDALSSAHTTAAYLDQPIDKTYREKLREMKVTIADKYNDIDLKAICASAPTKSSVNGTVGTTIMTVDATAYIEAQLAEVALAGGSYKSFFPTTGTAVKKIVNTYDIAGEETEVNVIWNVTFTAKDANQNVNMGSVGPFDYKLADIIKDIDLAKTRDAMYAKVANFNAADPTYTGTALADAKATWWAQLSSTATSSETYYASRRATAKTSYVDIYRATTKTPTGTYMKVYGPTKSQIIIKEKDILAMTNTFGFTTHLVTWYGVDYMWFSNSDSADNKLNELSFKLAYWPELSKVATIAGNSERVAELSYNTTGTEVTVNSDNLSRYFRVEGLDGVTAADLAKLSVTYKRLTDAKPLTGYGVAPQVDGSAFEYNGTVKKAVEDAATGKIEDAVLDWDPYNARDLKVQASLGLTAADGHVIDLNNTLPIMLIAVEPIKFEATNAIQEVERKPYKDAVAQLAANLGVYRAHETGEKAEVNMLKNNGSWKNVYGTAANTFYGLTDITYTLGEVRLGSADGEIAPAYPTTTLGIVGNELIYHLDSAYLQQDLYVTINVELAGHKYNWYLDQKDEHKASFQVRIYQNKE